MPAGASLCQRCFEVIIRSRSNGQPPPLPAVFSVGTFSEIPEISGIVQSDSEISEISENLATHISHKISHKRVRLSLERASSSNEPINRTPPHLPEVFAVHTANGSTSSLPVDSAIMAFSQPRP